MTPRSPAAAERVRVRMYTVGFGDCFLITIPGNPVRAVLVDAGFHGQGKGEFGGKELAEQVLADVTAATGRARLDVIVATHRHQDHVYAFNSPVWDQLEVGEVWLPWVEDRDNATARALWRRKTAFARALSQALPSFGLDAAQRDEVDWILWNAGLEPGGAGPAAWSNQGALDRLVTGLPRRQRLRPRYLPETQDLPETFTTDVLPDVKVHVLGPPRNPDEITEMDPIRDGESYRALALRALEAGDGGGAAALEGPFPAEWAVPGDQLAERPLGPDAEERISDLARAGDALHAAHALDDMINSTSLVLVLEIGSARLLLAGDAEWSTWRRILADERARLLLRGTTFVKVSHHGSHNGTPKSLVEDVLGENVRLVVSTQEGPGNYRNNIPLPALLSALSRKGRAVVRSDRKPGGRPKGVSREPGGRWTDLELPFRA